jgi:putative thiamine transport system ATP-binding protein
MGPSGSGKSSLLAYLRGTRPRLSGYGEIGSTGRRDAASHRRAADRHPFQDDLLFPHMTVGENLLFAIPRRCATAGATERMRQALAEADLAGCEERDLATLSGGQRRASP